MRFGGGRRLVLAAIGAMTCAGTVEAAGVLVPSRKPGLWELNMTVNQGPDATLQMCVDEETDKEMMDASLSIVTSICPMPTWSRDGNAIVILADCQISTGRTVVSRAELKGDFQSLYMFKVHTKTGVGESSTVDLEHEYSWIGPTCPEGLRPGFVRLPNGGKMKLKQMMKLLENMNGN